MSKCECKRCKDCIDAIIERAGEWTGETVGEQMRRERRERIWSNRESV